MILTKVEKTNSGIVFKNPKLTHDEKIYKQNTWKLFYIKKGHEIKCNNCQMNLLVVYKPDGELQTKCPYCKTMNGYKFKKENVACEVKYRYKIIKYHGSKSIKINKIDKAHYFNCQDCGELLMRYRLISGKIEIMCNKCGTMNGVKLDINKNNCIIHKRYLKRWLSE